jgi:hypothetical protein
VEQRTSKLRIEWHGNASSDLRAKKRRHEFLLVTQEKGNVCAVQRIGLKRPRESSGGVSRARERHPITPVEHQPLMIRASVRLQIQDVQ